MIDKKYEKERGGGRDNLNKEDDRDHISNNNVDETNKNNNNKPGIDVDLTIYNIFLHDLERDVKEQDKIDELMDEDCDYDDILVKKKISKIDLMNLYGDSDFNIIDLK